jgi:5-methylcytosine-specific restriction endonuclease McrA
MATHFTIPAASEVRVPQLLLVRILARDAFTCVYCGASGIGTAAVTLHVDHIRPYAHFPAAAPASIVNTPTNLVAACETCNGAKGPQDLAGFARMLRGRGVAVSAVRAMLGRVRHAIRRSF